MLLGTLAVSSWESVLTGKGFINKRGEGQGF